MPAEASADIARLAEALKSTAQQSDTTTMDVLVQSANFIRNEMLAVVPVRTGTLRNSIHITVESDRVTIGPNENQAPYAGYVEFGTGPHVIRPKKPGGVLKFKVGGTWVYAKKVNHPGTKPHPYVMPAFQAWLDSLGTMAAEANVRTFRANAE
jgi:HK97 gp10 family phage protein